MLDLCWYSPWAPSSVVKKSKPWQKEWSIAYRKDVCLYQIELVNSNRRISETNFQHNCAKARASTNHTDVFIFLWNHINKRNVGQFYCFCTCAECVKFQNEFSRIRKSMMATKMVSQKGRPPEGMSLNWLESFSLQKETTEEECDDISL